MKIIGFYDSHGGLWESCTADDPGAEAFGPRGISRQAEGPTWAEANKAGRIYAPEEGWDYLLEEPFFSEEGRLAVPGLLPGGRIIIDPSPPDPEGGEEVDNIHLVPGSVRVYKFLKNLYIQATEKEAEVWAKAQIQRLHETFSGCDWCCGGGDQLLALYQDILRAAT